MIASLAMLEALPVLFISAVAVAAYAGARVYAAGPANRGDEITRLRSQHDWLTIRLQHARDEQWGIEMEASLAEQLAQIEAELDRVDRETPTD